MYKLKNTDLNYKVKWYSRNCQDLPYLKNHSSVLYLNSIIIFGGYDGEKHLNTVYLYDISHDKCTIQETYGDIPKGRNGHTAIIHNNLMYMIGGWLGISQFASDEVYELNLTNFSWRKLTLDPGIGPSNMHSADLYNDEIFIFRGGNGREYYNDLISFNTNTKKCKYIETSGKSPHVRANHASKIIGHNLYIFGGWSGAKRLNDLHMINLKTLIWNQIEISGNKPSPRAGTQLIHYTDYLVLFGGSGANSSYLNDLYFFDIENKVWFMPSKVYNSENIPCERAGHSAVIYRNEVFIYGGGRNSNSSLSSIHLLEIDPEPKLEKKNPQGKTVMNLAKFFNNSFLSDVTIYTSDTKIDTGSGINTSSSASNNSEINTNSNLNSNLNSNSNDTTYTQSFFYGHKFILSLLCEKFKAMFSLTFEESTNEIIRVKYSYKCFEVILKYLYTADVNYDPDKLKSFNMPDFIEVMKIADEYLLDEVKDWCQYQISRRIDNSNYYLIAQYAKKFNADFLAKYCVWYQRQNKKSIMMASIDFSYSDLSLGSDI